MSASNRTGICILSCALWLAATEGWAQGGGKPPETQNEKESYSIGYQVGHSIRTDGVKVDFERLVQGLRDSIDGGPSLLGDEEMKRLIVDLRQKARDAQLKTLQETIVRNAEESGKYLEKNAAREGVRTTPSGLQYVVLKEGEGPSPKAEDFVSVHYRGTFIDGREFDSSFARGAPQVFQTDGVIKGWTEALSMMKVGSRWKVVVPPELAYGRRGLGEQIPPNSVLVFELELISINPGNKTGRQ